MKKTLHFFASWILKSTIFAIVFFLMSTIAQAVPTRTITATTSGDWTSTATWGGLAVPAEGDYVVIPTGVNVTYSNRLAREGGMNFNTSFPNIQLSGKLTLGSSATYLLFSKNVSFDIKNGGELVNDTFEGDYWGGTLLGVTMNITLTVYIESGGKYTSRTIYDGGHLIFNTDYDGTVDWGQVTVDRSGHRSTSFSMTGVTEDWNVPNLVAGVLVNAGNTVTAPSGPPSPATVPTVITAAASSITANSATLGGNVTADGGATVTERGVAYGASSNPDINGTHTAIGSNTGIFSQSIGSLTASAGYHVRAYAKNSEGISYGSDVTFNTLAAASISSTGTLSALNTTEGQASSAAILNVSGANMAAGITITAPTGFEVSKVDGKTDGNFGPSVVIGAAGTIASTPVYIRLKGNNAIGSYFGDVVLSSTNATSVNVAMPSSDMLSACTQITGADAPAGENRTFTKAISGQTFTFQGGSDNTYTEVETSDNAFKGIYAYDYTNDQEDLTIKAPAGYTFDLNSLRYYSDNTGPFKITLTFADGTTDVKSYSIIGDQIAHTFSTFTTAANDVVSFQIQTPNYLTLNNFCIDDVKVAPVTNTTISSIVRADAARTKSAAVNYTITFANAVTGLTKDNFTLTTTGTLAGSSVASVSGSGTTYTVTVNTGTGDGTINLNLANATNISPGLSSTLPFVGQTYIIDRTGPSVTISAPSVASTINGPVSYTVTYNDANFNRSTLGAIQISITKTGTATVNSVTVTGSGNTRTVTLSNISGSGGVNISIPAATAIDSLGNTSTASAPSAKFSVGQPVMDVLGLTAATPSSGSYSLRLLRSNYLGPLARILIGASYYDVYPDASASAKFSTSSPISAPYTNYNDAQTGATTTLLSSIITGNTATVGVWYDQSGAGVDAVQNNPGAQPEIINNGTIDQSNSAPAIKFNGGQTLIITTTLLNDNLSGTVVYTANGSDGQNGGAGGWYNMNGILGAERPNNVYDFGFGIYNGKFTAGNGPGDNSVATGIIANNDVIHQNSWTRDSNSGDILLYTNGVADGSATLNAGNRSDVSQLAIGAAATFTGPNYYGTISEMTLFGSIYSDTERQAVEGAQKIYYNIPSMPAITQSSSLTAMATTYGAPSVSQTIAVTATALTAGVLVTPPAGFEVSTDNITFTPTVTLGTSGNLSSTPVYIRIKNSATAANGDNLVLSSTNATSVNVTIPTGTINAVPPAGVVEFFEGATASEQTFTNATTTLGFTLTNNFTIGSAPGYGVDANDPPSITGGSNLFIDNSTSPSTNQTNTIKSTDGTPFNVKSLWVYPSSDAFGAEPTNDGTITFVGKIKGITVYTITKSGIFQTGAVTLGTNFNGFTLVDFSNGDDHSNALIDELDVTLGGAFQYLNIDNLSFTPTPSIAYNPVTGITGTTATVNATVNPLGYQTAMRLVYGTDNTLTTVLGQLVPIPGSLEAGTTGVAVSRNLSSLLPNTTYYYRLLASNSNGLNKTSAIQSFTTGAATTTVSSIARNSAAVTNSSTVNYTVTFAATVTGLTKDNFSLTTTGTIADAEVTSLTGSGTTYTVAINTGTGDGDITLNLANITNLTPGVSDALPFAGQTYTLDRTPPTTTAETVKLSDDTGISGTDFITKTAGQTISGTLSANLVTGETVEVSVDNGDTWHTATSSVDDNSWSYATTLSSNNTLKVRVVDAVGNAGTVASQSYILDTTIPTATVVVAEETLKAGQTSGVTITFSEPVYNFDNSALTIANGALSTVSSSDGGTTWTATLTPTAGLSSATNVISLNNTAYYDMAGNAGNSSTNSNSYAINTVRPTVTVVVDNTSLTVGQTTTVTFTFSSAVLNFALANVNADNGSLSNLSSSDGGTTWTATLTPVANVNDGTNKITVDNTSYTNLIGNAGTGTTPSNNYAVNTVPVVATVTTDAVTTYASTTATFSGSITANGGTAINQKGIVYSKTANPTTADTKVIDATSGNGVSVNVIGLSPNTLYYVRSYAINSVGTNYGNQVSFTTAIPTITLSPASLTAAAVGTAYSKTFTASGGAANYTFEKTSGTLPAGLTLATDGTLSGTPTEGGNFTFNVKATDAGSFTGTKSYTLAVNAATITITQTTLPSGTISASYSQSITATGGTSPYKFIIISGSLPNGLILAEDGTLSGTPTVGGPVNFTVKATDASTGTGPYFATQNYTLQVIAPQVTVVNNIAALSTTYGTASASTSFTVSASNLQGNLVVTAPTGFQVSTTSGSGFGGSVSLAPVSGSVNTTTVYLRLSGTADANTYNNDVVISTAHAQDITVATQSSTISKRGIIVTATAKGKIYGETDPALAYTYTGTLVGSDAFTGDVSRTAGETAGTYAINQNNLALSNNYTLTYHSANFTIGQRALAVTTAAQNKQYDGNATAIVTLSDDRKTGDTFATNYTSATFANADAGVGKTVTVNGISISGGAAANYTLASTTATTSADITKVAIAVTAAAKNKTYGDEDPALTYTYTGTLVGSETFTGALSRAAGENVGAYAIGQNTLTLSNNYALTYTGANLTIGQAPLTITATGPSKNYGTALTAGTSTTDFTVSATQNGEQVNGVTLTPNAAGLSVSTAAGAAYVMTPSAATGINGFAVANYNITYVPFNGIIGKRTITVTANAKSKTYGDSDPSLNYVFTPALVGRDGFTGTLSRAAGENVGTYAIGKNTLSLSTNYTLVYNGADLTIGQRNVTVTADAQSKTYGTADPALTYKITTGSLAFSDTFAGKLSRAAGETIGVYPISQGTLSLTGNYALTYAGSSLTIGQKTLIVTVANQSKVYGQDNPTLAVTYNGFANGDTQANITTPPTISTVAAKTSGAGTYAITASGVVIPGYVIQYVPGTLTVTKAPLTITADNKAKLYGTANPALTAHYTGFVNTDTEASLTTQATISNSATATTAPGNYPIAVSGAASNNYNIAYVNGTLTIIPLTNAVATNLVLSTGTLSPVFAGATTAYTTSVPYYTESIMVTASYDATASATINGTAIPNGSPSFPVTLPVGTSTITVVVTAQDGVTKNSYTITIYKASPPSDIIPTNILSPNGDGKNDNWIVKDIQLYPNNTVSIYDAGGRIVYQKKGYNNDWGGTLNGAPLAQGTYFYVVELAPGIVPIKGFITVLRNNSN